MSSIAIVHPGRMGAAIGGALVGVGHQVGWLAAGRGEGTRRRARAAGLRELDSADHCDVVVSVCPPSAALETATGLSGYTGLYVDANAVSPATAEDISAVVRRGGAQYVDAAVIGPPPAAPGTTRLYLSGERANDVAELFEGSAIRAVVLNTGGVSASALKMTYAAYTKITAALLVSLENASRELGVHEALSIEWELSQSGLGARLDAARDSVATKGWRWMGEMEEISRTFASAGEPVGFADAAAELFARSPRPADD